MQKLNILKIENELNSILESFNGKKYLDFSKSISAYDYAEVLNKEATYCLYCNIESIEVVRREYGKKGERATFDHFVRQNGSETDLSINNLIPCCSKCNSYYKGRENVDKDILHPFKDNFDELAEFSFKIATVLVGKEQYSDENIKINIITEDDELKHKTRKYLELFNIIKRYNTSNVKNNLKPFFREMCGTTINKIKDYITLGVIDDIEDILSIVNSIEINKTQYGKLKKDIIKKHLDNIKKEDTSLIVH